MQYDSKWEERRLSDLSGTVRGMQGGRKQELGWHPVLLRVLIHLTPADNLIPSPPFEWWWREEGHLYKDGYSNRVSFFKRERES